MRADRRNGGSVVDKVGFPRSLRAGRVTGTVEVDPVPPAARQWPPPPPPTPPRRRPLHRRGWTWAALSAVVVLGATGTVFAVSAPGPGHPATATPLLPGPGTTTPAGGPGAGTVSPVHHGVAHGVPLGDYSGVANPFGVAVFGLKTGTIPAYASDYLDKNDGWATMVGAATVAAWSPTHYHLVLGVPILPGTGTLAVGATGAYNPYFTTLAQNLVNDHEADAILRLGWEFNGDWFPWSVATAGDAADFVAFWRQIVTTMRAVPGAHFQFLWNPNAPSPTSYSPSQAYPGDRYVDYVGTDLYDNYWGPGAFTPPVAWTHQLTEQWGLNWLTVFALDHNKRIAIPEWSDEYRDDGHGLGDDPSFIDNMATWLVDNNVKFANVLSYDSSSTYRNDLLDGTFPKALKAFKADFG